MRTPQPDLLAGSSTSISSIDTHRNRYDRNNAFNANLSRTIGGTFPPGNGRNVTRYLN